MHYLHFAEGEVIAFAAGAAAYALVLAPLVKKAWRWVSGKEAAAKTAVKDKLHKF